MGVNEADGSYKKYTEGRKEDWCGDFVNWCLKQMGSNLAGGRENASCDNLAANILKKNPNALDYDKTKGLTDSRNISAGDVVFFSKNTKNRNDYTHTGIVTGKYIGKDGKMRIATIEGNSRNQVSERNYALDDDAVRTIMKTV